MHLEQPNQSMRTGYSFPTEPVQIMGLYYSVFIIYLMVWRYILIQGDYSQYCSLYFQCGLLDRSRKWLCSFYALPWNNVYGHFLFLWPGMWSAALMQPSTLHLKELVNIKNTYSIPLQSKTRARIYPAYHTAYDTFDYASTYIDPGELSFSNETTL